MRKKGKEEKEEGGGGREGREKVEGLDCLPSQIHSQLVFLLMPHTYIFTRHVPRPGGLGMRLISHLQ